MKAKKLISVAFQSILKNKMRTLLTMLGIIIGVGAVIVMVAIGQGAQSQIERQIAGLGTNLIVVFPGASQQGNVSMGMGSMTRLTLDDVEKLEREATMVSGVSPVVRAGAQVIGGIGNWMTTIYGVSPEYLMIREWPLQTGEFFTDAEVRSRARVAVLGTTVSESLFPGEDPVGQQIRLRNVPFTIIGVLAEKGQSAGGVDQDDMILAPHTTVLYRLSGWRFLQQIVASAIDASFVPAAQEEMREILRESQRIPAWENDTFTIRNQTDLAEAAQETSRVMTLLLASIAGVSLLVGGIGIMNIMLVSVTERTREIGIRMAIGARGSDILIQFLIEAIILCMFGGLIGILIGYGSAYLVSMFSGWSVLISGPTVVIAVAFSALVGMFFGLYPARKAAALNPIDALRHE